MTGRYKLYGCKRCGSMLVEGVLAEIGAPYDLVDMNYKAREHLGEAYRKINPLGRIPALALPDGTIVTESAACLLTLCDRHPEAGLLPPAGSSERAVLYRWLLFVSNNIYEAIGRDDYPERYTPDPAAAHGVRENAVGDLKRFWQMVETHLKPAPFALGERFSALDIYIANICQWSVKEWIDEHCPRLAELCRRVAARPRMQPVWQRHFGDKVE